MKCRFWKVCGNKSNDSVICSHSGGNYCGTFRDWNELHYLIKELKKNEKKGMKNKVLRDRGLRLVDILKSKFGYKFNYN